MSDCMLEQRMIWWTYMIGTRVDQRIERKSRRSRNDLIDLHKLAVKKDFSIGHHLLKLKYVSCVLMQIVASDISLDQLDKYHLRIFQNSMPMT